MSVKSSTELMLYVVLTMPTLNKAYLFIYLFIRLGLFLPMKTNLLEENTVNTLFSFNALQNIINKCNLLTLKVVVKLTIYIVLSVIVIYDIAK
jgi:hypothetical protein